MKGRSLRRCRTAFSQSLVGSAAFPPRLMSQHGRPRALTLPLAAAAVAAVAAVGVGVGVVGVL